MYAALLSRQSKPLMALVPPAALFFSTSHCEGTKPAVMTNESFTPLELTEKKQLTTTSNPTFLFRFRLSDEQPVQPVSSCLLVRAPVGDMKEDGSGRKDVMRPYTPVSDPDSKTLDLVVKVYPEGKIGNVLKSMNVGDVIDFKGPVRDDAGMPSSLPRVALLLTQPCRLAHSYIHKFVYLFVMFSFVRLSSTRARSPPRRAPSR